MAIYKIFPEKTATIYSYYPTINTGIDEIIELGTYESITSTNEVSRPLLKFPSSEISSVVNTLVSGSTYDVYLKSYLAYSSQLPLDYNIYCLPLAANWNVGVGRLANSPSTTEGVSWEFTNQLSGSTWISNITSGTTSSYNNTSGGGIWYTGSSYISSQSFSQSTNKDIEINVSNIVKAWYTGSITNNGFILKYDNTIEFTTASKFENKFFSGNTHTIYPPCLEIRWNDFTYTTGSLSVVSSSNVVLNINNKSEYQQDSIQQFRINVRDKNPTRTFQTSSVYLNNKLLPTSSYYSIKDLDTEEIVVDYDETYTKISANSTGNYFNIYLSGMEPERYYKILIKTVFTNGETVVFDDNYFFKVIR